MVESKEKNASTDHQLIEKAIASKNPLANYPELTEYSHEDFQVTLYCKTKGDMDSKTLKWTFKLAERNVGSFYKTSAQGWQPKIKQAELNKNWARYLVATDKQTKNPVAFAMFRFDQDYGSRVLYCYELQIDENSQRKGLGTFMMDALLKCAQHWKMERVVLTVLKSMSNAVKFYEKLGFKISDTSPDKSENADYEILCKEIE